MDIGFWREKKVLVTGHTGFKGSWLSLWLQKMSANLMGFALPPKPTPCMYNLARIGKGMSSEFGDIRDLNVVFRIINDFKPEIIIHMAAQPLVRRSYISPVDTYSTNVMGTVNILEATRLCSSVRALVNVTTDKCYENREWVWGYREHEPLGGYDPYSSSKGCAELVTSAYRHSFFCNSNSPAVASARAGNAIGGGDWAEDRLIPDILRAFRKGDEVYIRNPKSTRPWQHVLEPLSGYLALAQKLYEEDEFAQGAWNFGPLCKNIRPVADIVSYLSEKWTGDSSWSVLNTKQPHEATFLKLDISKAQALLGWQPKWGIEKTLDSIIQWEHCFSLRGDLRQESINQIQEFISTEATSS